jgi:hypothetical protein
MPKLTERVFFGGADEKLHRLGLRSIWNELETVLTSFEFRFNHRDSSDA